MFFRLKMNTSTIDDVTAELFSKQFLENLREKVLITKLNQKIRKIEETLFDPYVICITGYEYLQSVPGEHWTNRIKNLWKDAGLPSYYILDMYCEVDKKPSNTLIIFVELISSPVKIFVKNRLNHFIQCQNKETIICVE